MNNFMKQSEKIIKQEKNKAKTSIEISPFILKKMNDVNRFVFSDRTTYKDSDLDLIEIFSRVIVSGAIWKNRTERLSKRNNFQELKEYLDENYGSNYLLYRFNGTSLNEYFGKKLQLFPDLDHNFNNILEFCRSVSQWFELNKKNIVVIENKGCNRLFAFYLVCMLKYCNIIGRLEDGLAVLTKKGINTQIITNWFKYYNKIIEKREVSQIYIHQIIITTLPKNVACKNNKLTKFDIIENNSIIFSTKADLLNEDYIIVNLDNIKIRGDIKIKFFYENVLIFTLYFNSFGFEHGLYRFQRGDLIFPSDTIKKKHFDEEFTIDIVFFENSNVKIKPNYDENCDIFILLKHFIADVDHTDLHLLVSEGYNKYFAKLSLLITENFNEAKELLSRIDKPKVSFVNKKENGVNKKPVLDERPYHNINYMEELVELEPISDKITLSQSKPKQRMLPPKYKKEDFVKKDIIAKKPFYWTIVTKTPESIFNEMDNINILIDYSQFEEWFCESFKTHDSPETKKKPLLTKRMFLTSLAIKTLQKKKFNFDDTNEIINCSLEDLKLLLTILPVNEETDAINKIPEEERSDIETGMLSVKKNGSLIKILLFEREFFSEYSFLKNTLDDLLDALKKIIDDYNLRIILKAVLELGNTINYRYSNFRKNAYAYKLCSLLNTKDYKGNKNGQNLMSFLVLTLKHNYDISPIFKNLEKIHQIKSVELHTLKDRMNDFIFYYKDSLQLLNEIEMGNEKDTVIAFLKYFQNFTKEFSKQYKECILFSSLVKRKFGEDEKCNIMEIITSLSNFLEILEKEYV